MLQRVSKKEAVSIMGISPATLDRRIQSQQVQVEREGNRVWVMMDPDELHDESGIHQNDAGDNSDPIEVVQLRERVRNLEELADYHRGQLVQKDTLIHELIEMTNGLTRALPPPPVERPRRSWWPWRRNAGP